MIGNRSLAALPPADWKRLGQTRHWNHPLHCHRQPVLCSGLAAHGLLLHSVWGADGSENGAKGPVPGPAPPSGLSCQPAFSKPGHPDACPLATGILKQHKDGGTLSCLGH